MRKTLLYLIIYILSTASTSASISHIEVNDLLGIYEDSTYLPEAERMALNMADSLKFLMKDGWVKFTPRIGKRYSFLLMPCVKLYFFQPEKGRMGGGTTWESRRWALFNLCDSSIYFFGDPLEAFSEVVQPYIKNLREGPWLIDLIDLYLNTLSPKFHYYIFESSEAFENICLDIIENVDYSMFYTDQDWEKDKELIGKFLSPLRPTSGKNEHVIELYSWWYASGDIEYWRFKISSHSMELIERKLILERIGPYYPLSWTRGAKFEGESGE